MSDDGKRTFKCDPFVNIKEPACIAKWQLIRLDMLVACYQNMAEMQKKMAPLQNKIFKFMQRELNDMDESEKWRIDDDEDETEENP